MPNNDEETAPLIDPTSGARPINETDSDQPWFKRRVKALTALEKILAVIAVICLLLMSIFVGLFAGTAGTLNKERSRHAVTTTIVTTTTVSGGGSSVTSTARATTTAGDGKQKPFPGPPSPGPTGKPEPEKKICLTQECILLAGDILRSIDTSVDPCDDFYAFANGGWINSHSLPKDLPILNSFSELADSNRQVILSVLEASEPSDSDMVSMVEESDEEKARRSNLKKLRMGYESCMDVSKLDRAELHPLLPLLREITDILGPFVPPGSELQSTTMTWANSWKEDERPDWVDTYSEEYRIPERLRVVEDVTFGGLSRKVGSKVDADLIRAEGFSGELEMLEDEVEESMEKDADRITKALAFVHSRGVDALIDFQISGDAGGEDPQVQELFVYQAGGGLPSKEYYEEAPIMEVYTRVVTDILLSLNQRFTWDRLAEQNVASLPSWGKGKQPVPSPDEEEVPIEVKMMSLAEKVVTFERQLIRAGTKPENLFNPTYSYNPYTFNNLSKQLSFMDLNTYVSTFNPRNFPNKLIVTHPPYIASVKKILAQTPDYVISAYFVTRMSLAYSSMLGPSTAIKSATRVLQEVLQGLKPGTPEDRQKYCLKYVDALEGLGYIGGKEFIDRKFGGDSKLKAEGVIYSIIDAFKARLPDLPWMDAESAKAAAAKAAGLYVKIGYPLSPNVSSSIALQRYYAPLTINEDFFGNGLRTNVLAETRVWQTLGKARERESWEMVPQLVNAYYSPPDGEIAFPAGILQPPFFLAEWPEYLNYGAFGSVASHELSHAFDNTGAQYDEKGRLRDWWTNTTVANFEKLAKCVSDTYSGYSIPGPDGKPVYINGVLTNGENLGDAGITFAFSAWKNATKSSITPSKGYLPGLNMTEEQLFFVASSRIWGQIVKPEFALSRIRTDPHSPNQWRSNGQLRGFGEFAKAFNCPAGSPMNPKKRCDVWNV